MPPALELQTAAGERVETPLRLREVSADQGQAAVGEQALYALANTGTTIFENLVIWADGPGAAHLMLAIDQEGEPGAWADPGQSIIPGPFTTLRPGDRALFWIMPLFAPGDVEDAYEFDIHATLISIAGGGIVQS